MSRNKNSSKKTMEVKVCYMELHFHNNSRLSGNNT